MMKIKYKKTVYRLLETNDISQVIRLMGKIKPPIIGLKSQKIYEDFCNYVHKTNRVVFAIASLEDKIVGFSITIIDYYRFWNEFLIHNPDIIVKVFINKIFEMAKPFTHQKTQKISKDINPFLSNNINNRSWRDSSPSIAKVLYIAVDRAYRKQGIGKGLYRFRHKVLKNMGVKRVDGKINQHNFIPIKLAHSEGRKIIKEKNGMLFSTFDI